MELLLKQNVRGLGTAGQVVRVADGYAQNFLLPRRLAIIATEAVKARAAQTSERLAKEKATKQQNEAQLATKVQSTPIVVTGKVVPNSQNLYAAIHESEIAAAITQATGIAISPDKVQPSEPLKKVGSHKVLLDLNQKKITITIEIKNRDHGEGKTFAE